MKTNTARTVLIRFATAMLCFFLFQSGCVYFNLFYNAKSAFDTAYRAHQKYLKEHPDSTQALPADVAAGYDKAITKSSQVLEFYPKKVKWHDDAVFLMGKANYYKGEYDKAIRLFRQLQKEYPSSPYIGESVLLCGRAYLGKGNLQKAEEMLNEVLEKYPWLDNNQEVSLLMAEVAIRREGKSSAIDMLEKTYKTITAPDKKMELIVKMAQLYRDLKLYDKALALLHDSPRVKHYPQLLYRIDFLLVSCYDEKGDASHALDLISVMLQKKMYFPHVPDILLKKGEILEKQDKTNAAIAVYNQITDGYPTSDATGFAWFALGRLYQVKKSDLAKAKECYDKAVGMLKDPDQKEIATKRSKAIEMVLNVKNPKAVPDTSKKEASVTTDYKIAELYWLELDQPDSAYKYFCKTACDTSKKALTPKALYSAAWIARYALHDSASADSLYNALIARYPSNVFSKKAQVAHGGAITVFTRQDSAEEAFHSAERILYDDKKPDSAAAAYEEVYRRFSDSEFGPRSLYAAAWINDNVLDKNRSAKALYELLCDSFPNSSYCATEARPRLKTVADTLTVLRAQKKGAKDAPAAKQAAKPEESASKHQEAKQPPAAADTSQKHKTDIVSGRDTAAAYSRFRSMPTAGQPVQLKPDSSRQPQQTGQTGKPDTILTPVQKGGLPPGK
jgi:TolA-binding protein